MDINSEQLSNPVSHKEKEKVLELLTDVSKLFEFIKNEMASESFIAAIADRVQNKVLSSDRFKIEVGNVVRVTLQELARFTLQKDRLGNSDSIVVKLHEKAPDHLEDPIAATLYPDNHPVHAGKIDTFVTTKNGNKPIDLLVEVKEAIKKELIKENIEPGKYVFCELFIKTLAGPEESEVEEVVDEDKVESKESVDE